MAGPHRPAGASGRSRTGRRHRGGRGDGGGAAERRGGLCGLPGDRRADQRGLRGQVWRGFAALLSMLNSCAANVAVVNIDAGFKGGYLAGLIAQSAARRPSPPSRSAAGPRVEVDFDARKRISAAQASAACGRKPQRQFRPRAAHRRIGRPGRLDQPVVHGGLADAAPAWSRSPCRDRARRSSPDYEPSYMTLPLPDADGHVAAARPADDRLRASPKASVVACGPGLGQSADVTELVAWLYNTLHKPMVVDADALERLGPAAGRSRPAAGPAHPHATSRRIRPTGPDRARGRRSA